MTFIFTYPVHTAVHMYILIYRLLASILHLNNVYILHMCVYIYILYIYTYIFLYLPKHRYMWVCLCLGVRDMHESCMNMNANMYVSTYICTIYIYRCIYYECIHLQCIPELYPLYNRMCMYVLYVYRYICMSRTYIQYEYTYTRRHSHTLTHIL